MIKSLLNFSQSFCCSDHRWLFVGIFHPTKKSQSSKILICRGKNGISYDQLENIVKKIEMKPSFFDEFYLDTRL